jgi:hypothetical protein
VKEGDPVKLGIQAENEATANLKPIVPMLSKRVECDLSEKKNSYNGAQARESWKS